ncbi:hypothetical protein F2Q68_00021743 [Brassica cretica]|uniref:Uncharacterized protein n=1 Tax=Brassica cretica TaxID=69181 RepID=A0A8S9FRR8_BRACR|nr:hypothetical protein F2Q68_00021743 [Brassica cretica]
MRAQLAHMSFFFLVLSPPLQPLLAILKLLKQAIEAGDEDGTENDETDVYVGISDKETTEAGDEDEAGDGDGTENDATGDEGTGGVLTFH